MQNIKWKYTIYYSTTKYIPCIMTISLRIYRDKHLFPVMNRVKVLSGQFELIDDGLGVTIRDSINFIIYHFENDVFINGRWIQTAIQTAVIVYNVMNQCMKIIWWSIWGHFANVQDQLIWLINCKDYFDVFSLK